MRHVAANRAANIQHAAVGMLAAPVVAGRKTLRHAPHETVHALEIPLLDRGQARFDQEFLAQLLSGSAGVELILAVDIPPRLIE